MPARDRARGAVMYTLAAVLVAAGGVWWVTAAPDTGVDSRLAARRALVEELLPDRFDQVDAGTLVLDVGPDAEAQTGVSPGRHVLDVVCAGQGQVRVRVGTAGADGGRAVPCADRPSPVTFTVGLGTEFSMVLNAETDGAVIVRWRLTHLPT